MRNRRIGTAASPRNTLHFSLWYVYCKILAFRLKRFYRALKNTRTEARAQSFKPNFKSLTNLLLSVNYTLRSLYQEQRVKHEKKKTFVCQYTHIRLCAKFLDFFVVLARKERREEMQFLKYIVNVFFVLVLCKYRTKLGRRITFF